MRLPRILAFVLVALALLAGYNTYSARQAEAARPHVGQEVNIDGVPVHYVEMGEGDAVVFIHGAGSSLNDFALAGLLKEAARRYRVIAFDRPGYGTTPRPRDIAWTPQRQAELLRGALARLGVSHAILVGHSFGAQVAVNMALQDPSLAGGLVLISGFYYPDPRLDMKLTSALATPGLNEALNYTLMPPLLRLFWPQMMEDIYGPNPVPALFTPVMQGMTLRPWQLVAVADDVSRLNAATQENMLRYHGLDMPVAIVVGGEDRLVSASYHSERLHAQIRQSTLRVIPNAGHMVHHFAQAEVMAAIDEVAHAETQFATAPARHSLFAEASGRPLVPQP